MPCFPKSKIREKNRKKRLKKSKNRSMFFNSTILIIAGILGIFYLIQTNFLAIEGYKVDDLKQRIAELERENRRLEIKTIELRSIINLDGKVANLNMVEVDNIINVDKVSSAVALH